MRALAVALLFVALPLAGCFGGDDETPPQTTTPSVTPTANVTPTTPTRPTGNVTPTPTPTPVAQPKDVCTVSADFAPAIPPDPANPANAKSYACGSVPAGYKTITLNVTSWTVTGVVLAEGLVINLVGPDGSVVASCAGPAAGATAGEPCTAEGSGAPAVGDYTVSSEGAGNVQASVTVSIA